MTDDVKVLAGFTSIETVEENDNYSVDANISGSKNAETKT